MVSTSFCVAHVGKITGVRSVLFTEDDIKVLPLFSKWSYPFCSRIISPDCCDNGKWRSKTVSHPSYHELAYLHPDQFKPKESVASKYVNVSEPYVILRFSKLNKRFEKGVNGITVAIAKRIIQTIEPLARIYISSDVDLDPELVPYNLKLKPGEMHHVMAFARLFVGDSHTMAAESAVLGVPFVRINEFVDRLSYLRELEARYGLGIGFLPKNAINALPYIHRVLSDINTRAEWAVKRERMLSEKMNLLHFMIELVETYRTKGRFSFKGTFNKFFR
jgi:predicted glycosyltransferase